MRGNSRHRSSRPDRAAGRVPVPGAPPAGNHLDVEQAELTRVLEPVVHAAGADLESVRISSAGRRRLLRVYVDADGGVGLDEIALISRELSARLDATGAMGEAPYTLEVSSPGVDRPLTQPRHWRRATGRLVQVPVTAAGNAGNDGNSAHSALTPAAGRPAQVEGRVVAAGEHGVTLDVGGEQRQFGYAELGPGRVQVEFGRLPAEPGTEDDVLTAEPGIEGATPAAAAAGPRTRGRADGH
jgi:ribosome maturation factor RimP